MWFRFPKGCDSIDIQQQTFRAEAEDEEGLHYFRAPDHFAAIILDLNLGFRVMTPEKTDLKDLPRIDPERDSAIEKLSGQVDALRMEKDDALAQLEPLQKENEALRARVAELEAAAAEGEGDGKADGGGGKKK